LFSAALALVNQFNDLSRPAAIGITTPGAKTITRVKWIVILAKAQPSISSSSSGVNNGIKSV
jgi:hypothetical protein